MFFTPSIVAHEGQRGTKFSPRPWGRLNDINLSPDGGGAFFFGDDFGNFGSIAPSAGGTTAGTAHGGYGYYVDTTTAACSIKQIATQLNRIQFATSAQDNYEATLQAAGGTGAQVVVNSSNKKLLIAEAKINLAQVSNTYNFFVGLSEEGCAAQNGVFASDGTLASKDRLGFWVVEGDGDALIFGFRKAGGSAVTVGTYALSASTDYNLALVFDPDASASKRISWYVNNEEQNTYITEAVIEGSTFPNGEEMSLLAGIRNQTTAAKTADIDFWALFQAA